MSGEFESVAVWVGRFDTEARLREYMDERYSEDDDEAPISQFAVDQSESFYNHDYVESGFRASRSAAQLLQGHSYSKSYVRLVQDAMQSNQLSDANTVILVWNQEIEAPRPATGLGYELAFLGTFPCDPLQAPVDQNDCRF